MAAPPIGTIQVPTGYKMPDGWQTVFGFQLAPGFSMWERAVKPPGIDGKEAIDTTTMHNARWRTMFARHLVTLTELTAEVGYDPDIYNPGSVGGGLTGLINVVQSITLQFPDNTKVAFWGFLQKFDVKEHKEGEFPVADITVTPTNWDPNTNTEAGPNVQPAAGT